MDIIRTDLQRVRDAMGPAVTAEPDWRDRLVELQVLAEHGDLDAAAAAAHWRANDPAAEHAWTQVETTCQHLRTPTGTA